MKERLGQQEEDRDKVLARPAPEVPKPDLVPIIAVVSRPPPQPVIRPILFVADP